MDGDDADIGASFAEDLERFAEDTFIQAALEKGQDLRGYSKQSQSMEILLVSTKTHLRARFSCSLSRNGTARS